MTEITELAELPNPDLVLDGGETGCGELLLDMRLQMRQVPVGGVLEVITTDRGAAEDLPAWCRLTGQTLLGQRTLNPRQIAYFIKKIIKN